MQRGTSGQSVEVLKLDFTNCNDSTVFSNLELLPPSGYKLSKIQEHQFCEYRLTYKDQSVLYIGTNIYNGSKLNAQNRFEHGIKTYSINRSMYDTIRNGGMLLNQTYWLEWIKGNYVVGYLNATDTVEFSKAMETIRLSDKSQ